LALFVNAVSALFGYFMGLNGMLGEYWSAAVGIIQLNTGADYYNAPPEAGLALLIAMILGFWFLSILIEGALLALMEWMFEPSYSVLRVLRASLVANTASYMMLIAILLVIAWWQLYNG
jgi:hypothetical protein